jgi:2,3-diketo-5-methylthio-1-phosphopentane phosphatase
MRVLLDFDGTITSVDTVDLILERFALPQWRDIEREWESGAIGSRECLQKQSALVRATPEQLDELIDHVQIDPGIHALVRRCVAHSVELVIVSDGYDRVIRRVQERAGLSVPFVSNVLAPKGRNEWTLHTPSAEPACRVSAAHCKCRRARNADYVVLIGDGRSDFCVAHAANFIVAKGKLARYCADRHLRYAAIEDLEEAIEVLESLFVNFESADAELLETGEIA